jgi:hypothetical protein
LKLGISVADRLSIWGYCTDMEIKIFFAPQNNISPGTNFLCSL